jgi:hypothetical protein
VARLPEDVALFAEDEHLVHAEHFRSEYFASKLAYLSNIFEKFSTVNTSMQGNDTSINIIAVTDKCGGIYWQVGIVGQIIRWEHFGNVFSFEEFCSGEPRGNM